MNVHPVLVFRYFIILSVLAFTIYCSLDYNLNYEKNILGFSFNGKVIGKEITKHNHGALYLHLGEAKTIGVTKEIFDLLEVGDSISKKTTDSCLVFFKNSQSLKGETLYNYGFDDMYIKKIKCCCRKEKK